jgi:hypothetical protein
VYKEGAALFILSHRFFFFLPLFSSMLLFSVSVTTKSFLNPLLLTASSPKKKKTHLFYSFSNRTKNKKRYLSSPLLNRARKQRDELLCYFSSSAQTSSRRPFILSTLSHGFGKTEEEPFFFSHSWLSF